MTNQIPGCTRVNYIAPIKNPHSNGYIINYESATILPLPTATYSTNGGSAYTATIGIEFVGPCGVRSFITTSQSIQANGLNITITNSPIPSTVS